MRIEIFRLRIDTQLAHRGGAVQFLHFRMDQPPADHGILDPHIA